MFYVFLGEGSCDSWPAGDADRFTLCVCFCVPTLWCSMRTLRSKLLLGKNEYSIGTVNVLKTTKSNRVFHNNENINETYVILTFWCKTFIIHYKKNLCFWKSMNTQAWYVSHTNEFAYKTLCFLWFDTKCWYHIWNLYVLQSGHALLNQKCDFRCSHTVKK